MKLRNILLIGASLPLLGACVAYGDGYGGGPGYVGGPAYYGDAYPSSTYIEYNNSRGHGGGYRENYWSHDRAREENYHRNAAPAHVEEHHEAAHTAPPAHAQEHHDDHGDDHGGRH